MFDVIDSESERTYILAIDKHPDHLPLFEENVNEFIKSDKRDIVIDLKSQEDINSKLLSLLIRINKNISHGHRELRIKNCSRQMYRSIELAGLESFFSFSSYDL